MSFYQQPPALANQYQTDRVLRSYLARALPDAHRAALEPSLETLGALAAGELYEQQRAERLRDPELTHYDPWGRRVDHIELTPLWKRAAVLTAEHGLVARGYDRSLGAHARTAQFALVHLFAPATDVFTCPLAMTDGAARTLLAHRDEGNAALVDRALAHLLAREPSKLWTSGQWMTERTGGSDVGRTETVAVPTDDGRFRLYGTKWFSSATTSEMALTLARPEGNEPGGRGLALFYLETRDAQGALNHLQVNRLKDKLGTRKVPTAELTLAGTYATALKGTRDGVRNITPMLSITRTWNAVCAVAGMRRAVALVRDYAARREAFGAPLADKPLHRATVASLQAEYEAAFFLVFRAVALLGAEEHGALDEEGSALLRLLTPLLKLTTGKQAVRVASEALECFGGAGYVEDTGLPVLLRDAQVLPIWEGTTNVLSLDALRALGRGTGPLDALVAEVARATQGCDELDALRAPAQEARAAVRDAAGWLATAAGAGARVLEAGARAFALTLGRATALALLCEHARWALRVEGDRRPAFAAQQFARNGVREPLPSCVDEAAVEAALAADDALANDRDGGHEAR